MNFSPRDVTLGTNTVLISALARLHPGLAFSLFSGACRGLDPGPHLISAVLAACADLPHLYGRQVHARTTKAVPPNGVFVYTRLVDAYAKAG